MDKPLVSIIIPVYNSGNYLKETLKSISEQDYEYWECIIVDDSSNDNSVEIALSFVVNDQRFKLFERPLTIVKGANSCRNFGFEKAIGKYVNWFDSDDIMLKDFLQKKIRIIVDEVNIVISSGYFVDSKLKNKKKMILFQSKKLYQDYFLWRLKIITNSVLFRREFLLDKELFDINLQKSQEFDFFTRIFINVNFNEYRIIEDGLFLYRSNPSSITNSNQVYNFILKESESYTILVNLKSSIEIKNFIVAKSAYRLLINLLHKSIVNNHTKNIKFIFKGLKDTIGANNRILILNLKLIIRTSNFINISFTYWDKIIKKVYIKFN